MFDWLILVVWCWFFPFRFLLDVWFFFVGCLNVYSWMFEVLSEFILRDTVCWMLLWSTVKALFWVLCLLATQMLQLRPSEYKLSLRLRWLHHPLMVASRPSCFNLLRSIPSCGATVALGSVSETVKKSVCVYVPMLSSMYKLITSSPPQTHTHTHT